MKPQLTYKTENAVLKIEIAGDFCGYDKQQELAEKLKLTVKGVEWQLTKLKNEGIIVRVGADRGGKWEITK